MDITIPAHKIKTFTRALQCITKFGDELALHASPSNLKLSTINASRSAFCLFTFDPGFFQRYRISARSRRKKEPQAVQLQILGKTLNDIFRQKAVASAQKVSLSIPASDFERAEEYASDEDSRVGPLECRLTVTIHCPHGVKKTYKLTYAAGASMIALANKDECQNHLQVSPRTLKEWTDHFILGRHGTDEITLWCTQHKCRIRSFEDALNVEPYQPAGAAIRSRGKDDALSKQSVSTLLSVAKDEFDEYDLKDSETLITVSLKEFKAIIDFAVALGDQIDLDFQLGGDPLIASVGHDALDIQFVLSTNADDPAGIQREGDKDVKPRLSQMKLASRLPQGTASRQSSMRPSSTPAPGQTAMNGGRQASVVGGSRSGSALPGKPNSKPLFNPPDEDDEELLARQASAGEEEDDDALWDGLDQNDPSFSQAAMDLDNSTQSVLPRSPSLQEGVSAIEGEEEGTTEESLTVDEADKSVGAAIGHPHQAEYFDMSLEVGDETSLPPSMPKRPRRNWDLS